MKKLYLITHSFPWGKGEKTFILPELEKLVEEYKVTIISCAGELEKTDYDNITQLDDRIDVIHYEKPSVNEFQKIMKCTKLLFSLKLWYELFEIIKEKKNFFKRIKESLAFLYYSELFREWAVCSNIFTEQGEILIYTFWYNEITLACLNIRKNMLNKKILTRAHGCDLYNERYIGARQPFKKYMQRLLDCIVFASEDGYSYYQKTFMNEAAKVRCEICKLGVAASEKMSNFSADGVFRLVSCSNVIPLKRLELIIDGLSLIMDVPIIWNHFGDGEELERIINYANKKLGMKKNITFEFKGYQKNTNIINFYKSQPVDCFITTSETEGGCPLSIQEAMACGIPIIGTSVGDIPKMINRNGYLLSKNPTKEEVAEKIRAMYYLSEQEKCLMKKCSLQIWSNEYNADTNSDKMLEILHSL